MIPFFYRPRLLFPSICMCFKSYGQNFIKSNFNTAITKVEQKEKYVSHIFANVDIK